MGDRERAIATISPGARALYAADDPGEIMTRAVSRANVLADVIERKHLYVEISGKKHVFVEGWTMLATLHNLSPVLAWSRRLEVGDGWEARTEVYALDGGIRGAAECHCDRSEAKWADRDDHAIRSMAETRSTAKALRLPLGYVMALAGYSPTPAEEMPEDVVAADTTSPYYCQEHGTLWFKRGKMRNYAHAIGETGQWCNMPSEKPAQRPATARAAAAPAESAPVAGEVVSVKELTISDFWAGARELGYDTGSPKANDAICAALGLLTVPEIKVMGYGVALNKLRLAAAKAPAEHGEPVV